MKYINKTLLTAILVSLSFAVFSDEQSDEEKELQAAEIQKSRQVELREACMDKQMPLGKEVTYDELVKACPLTD